MSTDYKAAGVDRELAQQWVEGFQDQMEATYRPEVLGERNDFGNYFQAPNSYREPLWVATTDGVGTKLELAEKAGASSYVGIGQDLVAMCVNDLLACRAEPLVFLDYLATGKIEIDSKMKLMSGIVNACKQSGCSLIGGETAEMPGFYPPGRFDVAGFAIGVLEKSKRFVKAAAQPGDAIVGVASSGFHSNGYSLIRKIMQEQNWQLDTEVEGEVLGDYLLRPTTLYIKELLEVCRDEAVKAAIHITGGGLVENLPRAFKDEAFAITIDTKAWAVPPVMQAFQMAGKIDDREVFSTWNMGIGFCFIMEAGAAARLCQENSKFLKIGEVRECHSGAQGVSLG